MTRAARDAARAVLGSRNEASATRFRRLAASPALIGTLDAPRRQSSFRFAASFPLLSLPRNGSEKEQK